MIVGSLVSLVSLVGCGVRQGSVAVVPAPSPAPTPVVVVTTPAGVVVRSEPATTLEGTEPMEQSERCDDAAKAMCATIIDSLPDSEVPDYDREMTSCLENHEPRAVVERCRAMSAPRARVYATCMESALDLEEMNECEERSARAGFVGRYDRVALSDR